MNNPQAATAAMTAAERRHARNWLKQTGKPAQGWSRLAILAGFTQGLLVIAQCWLIAHLLHAIAIDHAGLPALARPFALLLVIFAGRAVMAWGYEAAGMRAALTVKTSLRDRLYGHLQALGPGLATRRHSGALATALIEQVEALEGYFARYQPQAMLAGLIPLACLVAVFPVDWVAGSILLFCAPLVPLFMALVGMKAADASQDQFRVLARMGGYFLDRLQGLTTLRLFGRAEAELGTIREISDEFRRRTMAVLRLAFLSSAVLEFFASLSIALVAVYVGFSLLGTIQLNIGQPRMVLSAGLFVLLLAPEFYLPLRRLAAHYHDRAAALAAAQELSALLDIPAPALTGIAPLPAPQKISIEFSAVRVAYKGGRRPALEGLSFTVSPGETLALVGASGAGKSTALSLLMGFAEASSGTVTVNSVPLGELDIADLRRHTAWIGQRAHLFHGTIADNIRLGRPDADEAALRRAAADAHVLDFAADLPLGLDTPVGERGTGLSGGQIQRVALARAFLKNAPLLLMDEPTSGLDADSEALVLAAIRRLKAGRTVIIATHSPAVMAVCDRVLEIADGRAREAA
ncbi:thiol reductant ABC exporter subunit CydD [Radicibacter daui]|uniref:thiol reductant ABC exporter subunit CydD n=1 Tax=Radicibacter daui TaxID=3064829 RepID=UPI004046EBC9